MIWNCTILVEGKPRTQFVEAPTSEAASAFLASLGLVEVGYPIPC